MQELAERVDYIEREEIKSIRENITEMKVELSRNSQLTETMVNSYNKMSNTMDSVKETMIAMSENMKQNNKVSEELANNVKSLNKKVDTMDDGFKTKFKEVDNKINAVNEKSKIDILDWIKNNWFGAIMGIGAIVYAISQII